MNFGLQYPLLTDFNNDLFSPDKFYDARKQYQQEFLFINEFE